MVHTTSQPIEDCAGWECSVVHSSVIVDTDDIVREVARKCKSVDTTHATVYNFVRDIDQREPVEDETRGTMMSTCMTSRFGRKVVSDVNGERNTATRDIMTGIHRRAGAMVCDLGRGPESRSATWNKFDATEMATIWPRIMYIQMCLIPCWRPGILCQRVKHSIEKGKHL